MKNQLLRAALALWMALSFTSCSQEAQHRDTIGDILGLSLAGGSEALYEDTHGGFHGDGYTRAVYTFEEDLAPSIAQNQGWKTLPATAGLAPLLDGTAGGPFLDEGGVPSILPKNVPFFPQTEEGFYYFRDRHSQAVDDRDEGQLFSRPSLNFTLALYDTATCKLYYVAYDT